MDTLAIVIEGGRDSVGLFLEVGILRKSRGRPEDLFPLTLDGKPRRIFIPKMSIAFHFGA